MADRVTVVLKAGGEKVFEKKGRPGGSYSLRVKYEGAFVIIVDEWDNETAIPAADVVEVRVEEPRHW